jgi:D-beta-D-heptose 7-phosphate kinase/D-beta-D-heptose 1-phosphate adenosyltransferase
MKFVVVTGGFDPIHSGHIDYIREAATLGDVLIVGVNSDEWLTRKKGKPFMNWEERTTVVNALRYVDFVLKFNDDDDSACSLLEDLKRSWIGKGDDIIFANGGDRNNTNNREAKVEGVTFVYGVGGSNKMNSSSDILKAWKE